MTENVQKTLNEIVAAFENDDIPEAVAYSMFPCGDAPSLKWSFRNKILMFLARTGDGRGFQQWKHVNRHVVKGAHAFYILVPLTKKVKDADGEDKTIVYGYKTTPVFRYEDTEGEPLHVEGMELPGHSLLSVAESWGIEVRTMPGNFVYYGYYSSKDHVIALATEEEKTFFHELAHAAHDRIKESLKSGQDPVQEIVAELAAQALCRLVGKHERDTTGNSYRYVDRYAKALNMSPVNACLHVLSETEKVLNAILGETE